MAVRTGGASDLMNCTCGFGKPTLIIARSEPKFGDATSMTFVTPLSGNRSANCREMRPPAEWPMRTISLYPARRNFWTCPRMPGVDATTSSTVVWA